LRKVAAMTALDNRQPSYVSTLLRDKYEWAAPDIDLGDKLWGEYQTLKSRPHVMDDYWNAAVAHYDALDGEQGAHAGMTRRGDSGELAAVRINRARRNSKARQALILAGIIRPKAQAATNDASSAYARQLAELILEYDFKRGGLDLLWAKWTEYSEVLADAYAFTRWNRSAGQDVGMLDGQTVRSGDLETVILPPWAHEFDENYPTPEQSPWCFVDSYEPKIDLVMEYTKFLDGRTGDQVADAIWGALGNERLQRSNGQHHVAHVVYGIHKPCKALPLGLWVKMLGADAVLERRPLIGEGGDYDETCPHPVIRLASDEMIDAPYAHAPFQSQIGPQELSDSLLTSHATLVTTYTDPLYAIPNQADEQPSKLTSGPGRVWRMGLDGKKPELVERPEVSDSAMKFDEMVAGEMERDMALNDAVTGQTEGTEKNAQAEALRASQAVQQVAPAAKQYRAGLMKLCELRIKVLRKNAQGERILKLVGQAKKHLLARETYTGSELQAFDSVEFEEGNPMEATPQGRWALVEMFAERGWLNSPEDAITVLGTGRLEPVVDPQLDENLLIKSENAAICRGELPIVFEAQNHILHMRKHDSVTMTVSALNDAKLLAAYDTHWNEHYLQEFGIDPRMDPLLNERRKFIKGLGPAPMAPMPGSAPAGPDGAPPMPPNGPAAVKPVENPLNGAQVSPAQAPAP
jgi:hypothetical protein